MLSLPALAEAGDLLGRRPGQALWPAFYPESRLQEIRRTIGPREWQALYQQRPAPEEGAYFQRDWFRTYAEVPEALRREMRCFGASDYAVTDGGGDYTVHLVAGVDRQDNIWLLDMWRGQSTSLAWVEALVGMIRLWRPQVWAEEAGVIEKSVGPLIEKRLQEERLYCTSRRAFASAADKPSRARTLQARMQMGKVLFPEPAGTPWAADLLAEMLAFPAGKHDDMVDALSLLCRMLGQMNGGAPAPAARVVCSRPPRNVWR